MAMPKQLRRLVEQSIRTEAKLNAIMAKLGIDEAEVDYEAARVNWNSRLLQAGLGIENSDALTDPLVPGTVIDADVAIGSAKGNRANYKRIVGPDGELIAAPATENPDAPVYVSPTTAMLEQASNPSAVPPDQNTNAGETSEEVAQRKIDQAAAAGLIEPAKSPPVTPTSNTAKSTATATASTADDDDDDEDPDDPKKKSATTGAAKSTPGPTGVPAGATATGADKDKK
jgi:hypothetical protein